MTGWQPISSAPSNRTIIGRAGKTRVLVECSDGDWYAKASTDLDDWVLDGDGERVIAYPDEWCEVP